MLTNEIAQKFQFHSPFHPWLFFLWGKLFRANRTRIVKINEIIIFVPFRDRQSPLSNCLHMKFLRSTNQGECWTLVCFLERFSAPKVATKITATRRVRPAMAPLTNGFALWPIAKIRVHVLAAPCSRYARSFRQHRASFWRQGEIPCKNLKY